VVLAFTGLLGLLGGSPGAEEKPASPRTDDQEKAKVVLEQRGYVVPVEQAEVWSRVSGHVVEIAPNAEVGKVVKKGDLLARLDPVPFEAAHRRAKAALKRAEARLAELKNGPRPEEVQQAKIALAQAEGQLKQLQIDLDRLQKLGEGGPVSAGEIEKAKGRVRTAELEVEKLRAAHNLAAKGARQEQLDAAEAEVEMARADLDPAAYHLDGTRIVSPVTGTILARRTQLGDSARSQSGYRPEGLFAVADLGKLEVELDVQERDIQLIFAGQKCTIQPEAFPKTQYQGKVSRLLPVANRAKGAVTVRVRIDVPAGDDKLRPDMGATVSFFAKE
jgi:multidrug resistance efflux pump